jgi:NAD(P)-dependent dehydrogenase (short-subunit alcohol dehydrogenase family)
MLALGAVAVVGLWRLSASPRCRKDQFSGSAVLITGGARGLGLALARRFAHEGAALTIAGRDRAALERARLELAALGVSVHAVPCDVRDRDAVEALVDNAVARYGRLDVLVNNAGIIQMGPFALSTDEDFLDSLATHFWAPLHTIRAARPHLAATAGRIINISSIGGRIAVPHLLPYCVGKFALSALSDGLSAELARQGISVLTVAPGLMRTGSHRSVKVRGWHAAEARWFALAAATPVTSMNVDRAAATIVEASRQRRARVTLGVQARVAEIVHALTPETAATVASMVARALPGAAGGSAEAVSSRDIDLGCIAPLLPRRDAVRMNQPLAVDEV